MRDSSHAGETAGTGVRPAGGAAPLEVKADEGGAVVVPGSDCSWLRHALTAALERAIRGGERVPERRVELIRAIDRRGRAWEARRAGAESGTDVAEADTDSARSGLGNELSCVEVAEQLGRSRRHVTGLASDGVLPARKHAGACRFRADAVAQYGSRT